jgi:hypothetical protein
MDDRLFLSAVRQSIGGSIETLGLELDGKLISKELADLVMLWNCRESLVQEVLQAEVVCAHDEFARPPMANGLDQANQLALLGGEFGMMRRHDPTEESHGPVILMQDRAHARARCAAVDDEGAVEVRPLRYRCRGQRRLEGFKCRRGRRRPAECVALEELCQRRHDVAVGSDEFAVIARQAEEAVDGATVRGSGHALTASIFSTSMVTPWPEMTWPR